ncbi:MAG TPA: class I SAM-dependent methyltransferase [Nitrososphaeraceae archaeon]|nr:class I SAM-dependent methyltransferase [Nitrososphaeraceae archaeon]
MSNNDFSRYMIDIINAGSLSLMLSLGHRTRIFDVMAQLPPSTAQEIASKSNLNERYVKEWLGAMVTGRIIDYNSSANKFSLSKEKAQYLTREKCVYNFAASMQWISVLSQVEDEIVDCFNNGGGVPYSSYKRFHEVMAEESYQTVVVALVDQILPLVPSLIDKLKKGIKVLDIGCGKGRAINVMANHFENSNFYGYDLSQEAIDGAKREAQMMGNSNAFFKVQDILGLKNFDEKYDLITAFDAIHDQPDPYSVLKSIYNSLDDKGIFLMQDILASTPLKDNIGHPLGPFLYTISCLHCVSVSLSQNGAGLGAMWGKEKATEMLNNVGFTNVEVKKLPHDFQNYYYIAYKNK